MQWEKPHIMYAHNIVGGLRTFWVFTPLGWALVRDQSYDGGDTFSAADIAA